MAKRDFAFEKENYIYIGIAILLIVIGFIMMSGGSSSDGISFNPEVFSKRRISIAPMVTLAGFALMVFGILAPNKSRKENAEEEKK